jgi:hypothetical protein
MKKAIEILEQHIKSYQSMVELYEDQPHNQAITEYTANEAKKHIIELRAAVAALKNSGAPAEQTNDSAMNAMALLSDLLDAHHKNDDANWWDHNYKHLRAIVKQDQADSCQHTYRQDPDSFIVDTFVCTKCGHTMTEL